MKKYKVIACKVMMREMYLLAAQSKNEIDIIWMEQELHNTPDVLRERVQRAIERVENETEIYDAIILGYCLCSNGIVGLQSKKIPIVIPKGHDCITMLLGSKERYREIFDTHEGGIYWYSPGWIEQSLQPGVERYEKALLEYTEKYGEDNSQFLMEMEQGWMKEYNCALYVDWNMLPNDEYIRYTKECAKYLGWQYRREDGSSSLVSDLFEGKWDADKFLIVPPGKTIKPSYDENVIMVDE
jgi:hypothetical protein